MQKLLALLAGALLLALTLATASNAATVIYYSKSDNAYGWCAGVATAKGETCAKGQCEKYGKNCTLAIECDGGYAATAFAEQPAAGFGATCNYDSANSARSIALFVCIAQSHAVCDTSEVFDSTGDVATQGDNKIFDQTLYTQALLHAAGQDPGDIDGAMGSKTQSAIAAFQSAVGLPKDGQISDDLFNMLRYAVAGTHQLIDMVLGDKDTLSSAEKYSYRYAAQVADPLTFTAEVEGLGDTDQRTALATLLTYKGTPCAIPAKSVSVVDANAQTWAVSCSEGDYDATVTADSITVNPHQTDNNSTNAHPGKPAALTVKGSLTLPQGHSAAGGTGAEHAGGAKG